MRRWDLREFVDRVEGRVRAHSLGEAGAYARWAEADGAGRRHLGLSPYGSADAANLLWTLDRFPSDPAERGAWVALLQGFQDPESGFFREGSHHEIHTTAHCIAALELFDARPRHALRGLAFLEAEGALEAFLDGLDWRADPWLESHRGAGIYAARVLSGEASPEWRARYFEWLWQESDPETGMFRRDALERPFPWGETEMPHLAATFHYLFNLESAGRPLRHPEALARTCLRMADRDPWPLGATVSFAEIDWVYCLTRSLAQCAAPSEEAQDALERFADRFLDLLLGLDLARDDGAADLHRLFGAVCAVAELQRALPDRLRTERPLRLVLDRRPFI